MTPPILIFLLPSAALWVWLRSLPSVTGTQRVAAAIGFGLAGSSTLFFLWRLAGGNVALYPIIDPLLWIVIGVAGVYRIGIIRTIAGPERNPEAARRAADVRGTALLGALAVALALLSGWMLLDWIRANPQGRWDAWAIWNLKAKFLMAQSDEWHNAFDAVLAPSQPDYPLLLPSAVARAWVLTGGTVVAVPIAISLAFTCAAVLTVVASLLASRGAAVAAMGLALVAVPAFVLLGAAQMADVPLAFYTVLAVSLLATRTPPAANLALAGAAMGFAAWTKNEGLVVATVLPACYALVRLWREGFVVACRTVVHLAIGLGPVLAIVALFKILLAPENELAAALLRPGALASWCDWARVRFVMSYMARGAASWGGWPVGGPVWLLVLLMLVPRRATRPRESAVLATGLYLVIQVAIFASVYVMTPNDVAWHLRTSWSRLLAQMWPTLVWWVCSTRATSADVAPASGTRPLPVT